MWHVYKITLEFFFLIKNYKHLLFQTDYFTMINYEFGRNANYDRFNPQYHILH